MRRGYKQSVEHVRRRIASRLATLAAKPKPVSREWMQQRYVDERMDCVQIGALLHRDPKTIWEWLRHYGIPTRTRGRSHGRLPRDGRSFRGRRHTAETREEIRRASRAAGRVPYLKNGRHWLHSEGAVHPAWRGGITPERQAFYASDEWRTIAPAVYARDKATCQRCGAVKRGRAPFDIHHVVSFACRELRAELSNLVLLCERCHYWVHSRANTSREFLRCP